MGELNLPPGPTRGVTLAEARQLQSNTLQFLVDAHTTWGEIIRYNIGFWDVYAISHPTYVQYVLLDNWRNFNRRTFQYQNFSRVTGEGLLTLDGDVWQQHRRLAQPAFHQQKLHAMARLMLAVIEQLAARWEAALGKRQSVDIDVDAALLRLALDILGPTLFGADLDHDRSGLAQELLALMHYVVFRSQNLLALPTWVPTGRNRRFRRRLADLDRRVYALIAGRRTAAERRNDFLDMLVNTPLGDGRGLTDQEIRDEIVTMVIAGYETVATGLSWTFKLLAEHKDVQADLREAFRRDPIDPDHPLRAIGEPDLAGRVFRESLRLYPPSWLISRRSQAADRLGEFDLPAGALVVLSPYAVHRHPESWPDPERFDPDRFLPESEKSRSRYAFIPFGGGPHLCIGRSFAYLEATLVLGTILPRLEVSLPGPPPTADPQVTIRPKPPLRLRLSRPPG